MEETKKKKKKSKEINFEQKLEKYIKSIYTNVKNEWSDLIDKNGMTYLDFFEAYRERRIREMMIQLEALYRVKKPAVIMIKKKKEDENNKTSNYTEGE